MKNFGTILALLAISASYVVSLPHEGNVPRGPYQQAVSIFARAPKSNNGNSNGKSKGKGQANAAAAANATELANNGTATIVNGTESAVNGTESAVNGTENANNGTAQDSNDNNDNGQSYNEDNNTDSAGGDANGNDAQSALEQLIAGLESQLGINLGNNDAAAGGQVNVADLLKLIGARDAKDK